jgi:ribose transport system permease protein
MTTNVDQVVSSADGSIREASPVLRVARVVLAKRFSGLWVLVGIIILFSALESSTFLTRLTFTSTLGDGAITALMALGLMFPLLTGVLDLSVAWIAGFAMVTVSHLTFYEHQGALEATLITLAGSMGFGLVSALLITRFQVNSLVTTLGVGTVALGITEWIANGNTITPAFGAGFFKIGRGQLLGVPLPFVYVLVVAVLMYYVLDYTALGRRLQAIGGNPVAARLAGIRVDRLQALVIVGSALMSGIAGVVLATQVGVATDATAPAYLLPAAAAVFLGATQIRNGANPWGTVLAVLLLGTGVKGLSLLGAESWTKDFFNGAVLLIAVSMSGSGIQRLH